MEQRAIRGYGWKPQLPDHRDYRFLPELETDVAALPPLVDLLPVDSLNPIYDQSQLGSCTGNMAAALIRFTLRKLGLPDLDPSRLYIYYKGRQAEGHVRVDSGAMIRDVLKAVAHGFILERDWPYIISTFATPPQPIRKLDALAKADHAIQYLAVDQSLTSLKACLAAGFPFGCGVTVYQSFENAQDGNIPMPSLAETMIGGHAIAIVGYDDSTGLFKWRNSWGPNWGQHGYGTLPYAYLSSPSLASDFWTIRTLTIGRQ